MFSTLNTSKHSRVINHMAFFVTDSNFDTVAQAMQTNVKIEIPVNKYREVGNVCC